MLATQWWLIFHLQSSLLIMEVLFVPLIRRRPQPDNQQRYKANHGPCAGQGEETELRV
jgi:hypothetical protein